jgi:hypothetical protein
MGGEREVSEWIESDEPCGMCRKPLLRRYFSGAQSVWSASTGVEWLCANEECGVSQLDFVRADEYRRGHRSGVGAMSGWIVQEWPHTAALGERWFAVPPPQKFQGQKRPNLKFFPSREDAEQYVRIQLEDEATLF